MKNRSWYCYALDIAGLLALVGAGLSLAAALWFAATATEAVMLGLFQYCLMSAVGAFLAARACEITRVFQAARAATPELEKPLPSNVKALPNRSTLQRAA